MSRDEQGGFSLIELMIVVLIIAVLAAIAIPSYQSYVTRAARTKATQGLMNLAGLEERYFYSNNTYGTLTALGVTSSSGATYCVASCTDSRYYIISVPSATSTGYTLTATPQGAQTKDTACGVLSLDNTGAKKASGDPSNLNRCWGS